MLSQLAGELVKGNRTRKGISQVELARAAKVSRTVLSRLEQGKALAVQTDVLDRLFDALQVTPAMLGESTIGNQRKRARLEQQRKIEQNRSRHLRLAIQLADDERAAAPMVDKARKKVELWKQKRSCSSYYIDRWAQLLELSPRRLASEMASLGEWEDAMFQNSPWSWIWS